MSNRLFSGIFLSLLLIGIATLAFNIQPVKASGTIYIRADGSIDPSTAPIQRDGDLYTLTGNITSDADGIVIERNNMTLDGAGYTVQGTRARYSRGIDLTGRDNVTVRNTNIKCFEHGVYLNSALHNFISANNITNNGRGSESGGIWLVMSSNNTVFGNNVTNNINALGGIVLYIGCSSNTISGNNIANHNRGIQICSSNNSIVGNKFTNDGLFLDDYRGNTIEGNIVNGKPLVYLEGVSNYTVDDAGQVILFDCDTIRVENLNLSYAGCGLWLRRTNNCKIANNIFTANSNAGICLGSASSNNTVSGNNIKNNVYEGIMLESSNNSIVGNNIANNDRGIYLWYSRYNSIYGNNITNNGRGFFLVGSSNNFIYHNFINNTIQVDTSWTVNVWDDGYPSGGNYWSNYSGVDLYSGPYQNLTGSDGIGDSAYVIDASNADNYPLMQFYRGSVRNLNTGQSYPTIQGAINNASEGDKILALSGTYYEHVVVNNTVSLIGEDKDTTIIDGNGTGTTVRIEANNTIITGFSLQNSGWLNSGIMLDRVFNSSVYNNNASNNWFGIYLQFSSNCSVYDNKANNNCAGIELVISSNCSVSGNHLEDNQFGMILDRSANCFICTNKASNNLWGGIVLEYSSNCTLYNNDMSGNSYNLGVWGDTVEQYLHDIDTSNTVSSKPVYYWVNECDRGVPVNAGYVALVNCTRITVENLNLTKNYEGILVAFTTNSTIIKNNITSNYWGILLEYSSNSIIYHNNFIANALQVHIWTSGYANVWDDGYPSGGNYWSDYTGVDLLSGPYQDETGSDGIGDTPRTIDANNRDRYPLMNLWVPPPPKYYLTVRTDPAGIVTILGEGWYVEGTAVTLTAPAYVSVAPSIRYRFNYWDVNGASQGIGVNPITMHIDANHTATAHYILQYQVTFAQTGLDSTAIGTVVTVNGNAKEFTSMPFNVWVDSGSSLTYSYNDIVLSGVAGKKFKQVSVTDPASPITVTGAVTVTGNYKTQYQITFDQTGVGSDFTGTVVTIDSSNYGVSGLPVSFWWDQGSGHSFSFASPLAVNSIKKYVWSSTSGLSTLQSDPLAITASGSVTGNYIVQNAITFDQVGVGSDFTGTVVIIDGVSYTRSQLPISFAWNLNSLHTFAFQSPLVVGANAKQHVWTSTTGLSNQQSGSVTVTTFGSIVGNYKTQYCLNLATSPSGVNTPSGAGWYDSGTYVTISTAGFVDITPGSSRFRFNGWTTTDMAEITNPSAPSTTVLMDKAKTVTANYVIQSRVTFNQSGVGSDFTGTAVTVDATGYTRGMLPYDFWWDSGSSHTFAYNSPLVATANAKQYVWTSTTGLSMLQGGSITVSGSGSVTGNYKTQYYFTVNSLHDSPTPTSDWFDAQTSITASVTSPWSGSTGTRYVCTGWTGTGSVPASGTSPTVTFTINQPSGITWNWKTQYLLTVLTNPSGLSPQPARNPAGEAGPANGWWYDTSAGVTLTAQSVAGYDFNYWDTDGASHGSGVNPITANMNVPHTVTAHYTALVPIVSVSISPLSVTMSVGQSVPFSSTVTGGTPPYSYQWYVNGNPVSGAISSSWAFTPTTTGTYYAHLKVTDASSNTAQSETAKIVVSAGPPTPPVGGEWVPIDKVRLMAPWITETSVILAMLGSFVYLKRKRRQC